MASELSPADLLSHSKSKIAGLVSVLGGPEGHFAIVARSLSIPTIVGLKKIYLKILRIMKKLCLMARKAC